MDNLFYKNLKYLRGEHGETQDSIASYLNKKRTAITNWENNLSEPNIDELVQIAIKFDVTVDDLTRADLSKGNLIENTGPSKKQVKGNLKGNPIGNLNEPSAPYSRTKKGAVTLARSLAQLQQLQQQQHTLQQAINTHLSGILATLSSNVKE